MYKCMHYKDTCSSSSLGQKYIYLCNINSDYCHLIGQVRVT